MRDYFGMDYETWSRTNLPERGLDNYVHDDEFKALIASVVTPGDGVVYTFDWVYGVVYCDGVLDESRDVTEDFYHVLVHGGDERIAAHNVGFERAVTKHVFQNRDGYIDLYRLTDSAVIARALGAESKLEVASRQLTNSYKMEIGSELVRLFCIPNEQYPDGPTPELIEKHGHEEKWKLFRDYCEMDAQGSKDIMLVGEKIFGALDPELMDREHEYEWLTYEMNQAGWGVDTPLVEKMKQRSWANGIIAQRAFTVMDEKGERVQLNFNSPMQLKKFCEDRGVKVKSLDKYHLPLVLDRVKKRISKLDEEFPDGDHPHIQREIGRLKEVEAMLETKAEIGGSALTKLPKILDLQSSRDGLLRDQYMHLGAGQTYRTTGKGVQMQNLGKLKMMKDENGEEYVKDVSTLYDFSNHWSNGDMAGQLRQVFQSRSPEGEVLVGDFSAVESRGLAYSAGEEWKLDAYREGLDVYKVLASKFFDIEYDEVTPELRPRGKYSELSCGYQASAAAVQEFMFRLGFEVSIESSLEDVQNWRDANPTIVDYWYVLDRLIKAAVMSSETLDVEIGYGMRARMTPVTIPSIQEQHPGSISLAMQIIRSNGKPIVTRFVHGLYFKGDKLCYYKPVDRLTRDSLWTPEYRHPKTGVMTLYSIYGGKVAGIFTQSLCRELFFESLSKLSFMLKDCPNAVICGQFHDEINVDWWPQEDGWSKEYVMALMEEAMSTTSLKDFPLIADIKSAHRYIK